MTALGWLSFCSPWVSFLAWKKNWSCSPMSSDSLDRENFIWLNVCRFGESESVIREQRLNFCHKSIYSITLIRTHFSRALSSLLGFTSWSKILLNSIKVAQIIQPIVKGPIVSAKSPIRGNCLKRVSAIFEVYINILKMGLIFFPFHFLLKLVQLWF